MKQKEAKGSEPESRSADSARGIQGSAKRIVSRPRHSRRGGHYSPMHRILPILVISFLAALAHAEDKHLLYLSSPDAAQPDGSGNGVLIFDIDDGQKFVRRIDVPSFAEGIRGFCANAATHRAYYTTTNHRLGCLDLETDQVVWEKVYASGCDRAAITPDGKKLYVPTGWWTGEGFSEWFVVDAANGEITAHLPVKKNAHNTVMSLDGQFVYCGYETTLMAVRTSDDTVVKTIAPIGESGVFPFTINARGTLAFVCLGKHVGFDVADLTAGTVLHRVFAGDGNIAHRTHGAALTPDEMELWISDQDGKRLYIFDATQMPPKETGHVDLSIAGHGWITFDVAGRYAYCHTPDVIDAKTKKVVATLKDEHGKPVCSSKFFETVFRDGKVVAVSDQFGVGRAGIGK
jgi:DNA-binding beta-propeller fold protein YncE